MEEAAASPPEDITLGQAIDRAYQLQPRLRVQLESIHEAEGQKDVVLSSYLPTVSADYSVGVFGLHAGIDLPSPAGGAFIPFVGGVIPSSLNIDSGFALAELKMAWLITDFGRRLSKYHQAQLAEDVARLMTDRAYESVAKEVTVAYYAVLRSQSLMVSATAAVTRTEEDLKIARKLLAGGVVERENVLRAEVAVAEAHRLLDQAEGAKTIAIAALNWAIGQDVRSPVRPVDPAEIPEFKQPLTDCLEGALARRNEIHIARHGVEIATEARKGSRLEFLPRVVAEGLLVDFQQQTPRAEADIPLGLIKVEWDLFEGGKRLADIRIADAKLCSAMAQARVISDTVAFEVTESYRTLLTSRKGIDRARPAVDQARENYRLVKAKNENGDATPTEITDAQSSLTRAEQDYSNSVYDYLTAIVRLQYAMGDRPY